MCLQFSKPDVPAALDHSILSVLVDNSILSVPAELEPARWSNRAKRPSEKRREEKEKKEEKVTGGGEGGGRLFVLRVQEKV